MSIDRELNSVQFGFGEGRGEVRIGSDWFREKTPSYVIYFYSSFETRMTSRRDEMGQMGSNKNSRLRDLSPEHLLD